MRTRALAVALVLSVGALPGCYLLREREGPAAGAGGGPTGAGADARPDSSSRSAEDAAIDTAEREDAAVEPMRPARPSPAHVPATRGLHESCGQTEECVDGLVCVYALPGCERTGECVPGDFCEVNHMLFCGCDGTTAPAPANCVERAWLGPGRCS